MKRRHFFSKLLQTAAIIGLAPRLAFKAPEIKWTDNAIYEQLQMCDRLPKSDTPLDLDEMFKMLYAIKREREKPYRSRPIG